MIKLFSPQDRLFSSNGIKYITPLFANVVCEDNGVFELQIEASLEYIDDLVEDNILVAKTPKGLQAFRISDPQKLSHKIVLTAKHVFFDCENYIIKDSYVVEKNCNDALDHLLNGTDVPSGFTGFSNVETVDSFRCVRKNLGEAVKTLLERWGGHLDYDNWNIRILESIGADNGVTIRYGGNLEDIGVFEDWSNVCTKILPVGKDGILLNALDETVDVFLSSEQSYEIPYTKVVSFDQDIEEDDFKIIIDDEEITDETAYTQALVDDLREQSEKYLNNNFLPKINYTLKAHPEFITNIGDVIHVFDERLNVNVLTHVVKYEFDPISERYRSIEFGNFGKSLSGLASKIEASAEKTAEKISNQTAITLGKELKSATDKIWSALGDSFVVYEGDKILVLDALPREAAVNVMAITSNGIGFSNTGINGTFNSAWTIDGTLDMQQINVVNLVADLIKGGTLKLGSVNNISGTLELYNESNVLIGLMNKDGLTMYGQDGSFVQMNNEIGFAGFDSLGNKLYWVDGQEFHMRKSVIEEEITLCNRMRFLPIEKTVNDNLINSGIGLVSVWNGVN